MMGNDTWCMIWKWPVIIQHSQCMAEILQTRNKGSAMAWWLSCGGHGSHHSHGTQGTTQGNGWETRGGNRKKRRAGFNWWHWPVTQESLKPRSTKDSASRNSFGYSHFHSGLSSSISSNGNIPSMVTSILSIITSHCPYLFLFHFLLFSIHFLFFPFSDLIPFCTLIISSIISDSFWFYSAFLFPCARLLPVILFSYTLFSQFKQRDYFSHLTPL